MRKSRLASVCCTTSVPNSTTSSISSSGSNICFMNSRTFCSVSADVFTHNLSWVCKCGQFKLFASFLKCRIRNAVSACLVRLICPLRSSGRISLMMTLIFSLMTRSLSEFNRSMVSMRLCTSTIFARISRCTRATFRNSFEVPPQTASLTLSANRPAPVPFATDRSRYMSNMSSAIVEIKSPSLTCPSFPSSDADPPDETADH
mmetsp:Transcript_45470/g.145934  ORF Transcript_45470/g.145934 Transcript_45470/m.145934 type:complete len:203 (-) Transcript_45470:650-1258(-)